MQMDYLAFEQPIADLEAEIQRLETEQDESADAVEKIRRLQLELRSMTEEIYGAFDALANRPGGSAQRPPAYDRLPVAGFR